MQYRMFSFGALLKPLHTHVQNVISSVSLHLINSISQPFCFGHDELQWEVERVMVMKCAHEGHNQNGSA